MTPRAERLITLGLLAAIAALALASALQAEGTRETVFFAVAAAAMGGFVIRLRPTRRVQPWPLSPPRSRRR